MHCRKEFAKCDSKCTTVQNACTKGEGHALQAYSKSLPSGCCCRAFLPSCCCSGILAQAAVCCCCSRAFLPSCCCSGILAQQLCCSSSLAFLPNCCSWCRSLDLLEILQIYCCFSCCFFVQLPGTLSCQSCACMQAYTRSADRHPTRSLHRSHAEATPPCFLHAMVRGPAGSCSGSLQVLM